MHKNVYLILFCLWSANAVQAAVHEDLQYDHYRVVVEPDESLKQAINRVTPIRQNGMVFHANTRWNVNWRAQWSKVTDKNCAIKDIEVYLTTVMQLPRLTQASPQQHETFNAYTQHLVAHEMGHHDIGRKMAFAVEKYLLHGPSARNCKSLQEKIDKKVAGIFQEYAEIEADYDRKTKHGETQGALLPF